MNPDESDKTRTELLEELADLRRRLEESEQQLRLFRALADFSSDAISVRDIDLKYVYINPAHEQLYGRSLEEARKINYIDYYPMEEHEKVQRMLFAALADKVGVDGDTEVFDASGRRFRIHGRVDAVFDERGEIRYFISQTREIVGQQEDQEPTPGSDGQEEDGA